MLRIKFFMLVWTFGLIGGLLVLVLKITGRVTLVKWNMDKFKPEGNGTLIIANHPSLWEAVILPLLFFPRYLWDVRYIPYSTPDSSNFYEKWWFKPFRIISIPIKRDNKRKEVEALYNIIKILKENKIVILFAEGGRTYRGKSFKMSRIKQKIIRRFKHGCGSVVIRAHPKIVLIWNEGGDEVMPNEDIIIPKIPFIIPRIWKKVTIATGEPIFVLSEHDDITELLEEKLLELADTV